MWLIAESPVTVRTALGEVRLAPGIPHELHDAVGARVLQCVGDRVRVYQPGEGTVIEAASLPARPIYWESNNGTLHGPAALEFLAKAGTGDHERFWVVVTYHGTARWVRSDRLRTTPR